MIFNAEKLWLKDGNLQYSSDLVLLLQLGDSRQTDEKKKTRMATTDAAEAQMF